MAGADKDAMQRQQSGAAVNDPIGKGALHSSQKLIGNLNDDSNGSKKLNSENDCSNSKNRIIANNKGGVVKMRNKPNLHLVLRQPSSSNHEVI